MFLCVAHSLLTIKNIIARVQVQQQQQPSTRHLLELTNYYPIYHRARLAHSLNFIPIAFPSIYRRQRNSLPKVHTNYFQTLYVYKRVYCLSMKNKKK